MRKRLIIYIPALAVILFLGTFLLINHLRTPEWRVSLEQYLAFQRSAGEPSYHLVSAVQASQPTEYTASMSSESYSERAIFSTSNGTGGQYTSNMLPVPYPPEVVWCVLLQNDSQQRVVYVALHNSLYNADWIVHVSPQPYQSPALQTSLSKIGCSFE
jgi:hypothetical protein